MNTLTLKPHSKVIGDFNKDKTKIEDAGHNKVLNKNVVQTQEQLKISELTILESQRHAKSSWAVERLKSLGGLDLIALGTLNVARDPVDKKNYVWDGAGRWLLCEAAGYTGTVNCNVIEMSKKDAAKYFHYTQDEGKRSLSKEAIFVNKWFSENKEALHLAEVLDKLGLYIKGDTDLTVPHAPPSAGTAEVKWRSISEAYSFMKGDVATMRLGRDMISKAYTHANKPFESIKQDFYWAVITLLKTYPALTKGKTHIAFQSYINWLLDGTSEGNITAKWKGDAKGATGNVGARWLFAEAMLKDFKASNKSNATGKQLRLKELPHVE